MTEFAAENYVMGEVADEDDYKTGNGSVDFVVSKFSSQGTVGDKQQQSSSNTKQDDDGDEVEVEDAEDEEEEEENRDRRAVGETKADAVVDRGEGGAGVAQNDGRQLNFLIYFPGQDEPIRLFHNEISQDDHDDVCIFPNDSLEQETLEVLLNSLHSTSFFNVPEDEEVVLDFFEHGLKISQV